MSGDGGPVADAVARAAAASVVTPGAPARARVIALPAHEPCGVAGYGELDPATLAATCTEVRAFTRCRCRGRERGCTACPNGSGYLPRVERRGCGQVVGVCRGCGLRAKWNGGACRRCEAIP